MTNSKFRVSIIIPTLNAENKIHNLISSLQKQSQDIFEIIVIDSSSTDRTFSIVKELGCKVSVIDRINFRHGATRNLGAGIAQGDIFVFLTQDIIPLNYYFLSNLISPIVSGKASASMARQIPNQNANPIEKFSRFYNYGTQSTVRSIKDNKKNGLRNYFFSNSASAYEKNAFLKVGGFDNDIIAIEDMDICARLILSNHSVAYQADSIVIHSHNLNSSQLFRRYFDTGVYHNRKKFLLNNLQRDNEGKKYIFIGTKYLIEKRKYFWLLRFFWENYIKWLAFNLGLLNNFLPKFLKKHFSNVKHYWN